MNMERGDPCGTEYYLSAAIRHPCALDAWKEKRHLFCDRVFHIAKMQVQQLRHMAGKWTETVPQVQGNHGPGVGLSFSRHWSSDRRISKKGSGKGSGNIAFHAVKRNGKEQCSGEAGMRSVTAGCATPSGHGFPVRYMHSMMIWSTGVKSSEKTAGSKLVIVQKVFVKQDSSGRQWRIFFLYGVNAVPFVFAGYMYLFDKRAFNE